MDYVFIDIETTGLEPENAHIISVGATKVVGGKTVANFFTYVNCPRNMPQITTELTGIYKEHLIGAPEIGEALKALFGFFEGCALVGCNLPFADKFLAHYAKQCGLDYGGVYAQKIDVSQIVKEKLGEELKRRSCSPFLHRIADYYGIPHYLNDCLSQAILLSRVYENLEVNL